MLPELTGKRSAEIVRTDGYGFEFVRGRTRAEVAKRVSREVRRGNFTAVSEVRRVPSGGYAVKARLAKPRREPLPIWARICFRLGLVLTGVGLAGAALLVALSELLGSLRALPWGMIGGVAAVLAIVALCTRVGRRCCTVVVHIWH